MKSLRLKHFNVKRFILKIYSVNIKIKEAPQDLFFIDFFELIFYTSYTESVSFFAM